MGRKGNREFEPSLEPELAELDRVLRAIRFRERASFASELQRRLRGSKTTGSRRVRLAPAAVAAAAIGLGLLQVTNGPWRPVKGPEGTISRPVLVCPGDEEWAGACTVQRASGSEAALYLTVNQAGTVLQLEQEQSSGSTVGYSQAAFACAFDIERALCGPPAIVASSGLGLRLALGPFIYRDVCCAGSPDGSKGRDGVLTVSGLRETVVFVFVYDDVNSDGRLSAGDRLRLRMHPPGPRPQQPLYASRDDWNGQRPDATTDPSERWMSVVVY